MKKHRFYIIKDNFFKEMNDPYLKENKKENRPHYYCFQDTIDGIYWMIPLSSRIGKYKRIMKEKEASKKACHIIHILKLDNERENAFLIQDMFPITEKYIEREYTIGSNHLRLTSDKAIKEIDKKARKVLGMIKQGVIFTPTQPDVIKIWNKLKNG